MQGTALTVDAVVLQVIVSLILAPIQSLRGAEHELLNAD